MPRFSSLTSLVPRSRKLRPSLRMHLAALAAAPLDAGDGAHRQGEVAVLGFAVQPVAAQALLLVPLDEAREVALARMQRAMQARGSRVGAARSGREADGLDVRPVQLDLTRTGVAHEDGGADIVRVAADLHALAAPHRQVRVVLVAHLDALDVPEARDEHARGAPGPAVRLHVDLEAEDLDVGVLLLAAALAVALVDLVQVGQLGLGRVEEVVPEGLLVGVPAQEARVLLARVRADRAVEEAVIRLLGRQRRCQARHTRHTNEEQGGCARVACPHGVLLLSSLTCQ